MMLAKRIQNKGQKYLALILSALLILSLNIGFSPMNVLAEGETPSAENPSSTQEYFIVTLSLKSGDVEATNEQYKELSLRPENGSENQIYFLGLKKAKVPSGTYFFYHKNDKFIQDPIIISKDSPMEFSTELQNMFSIHLSWNLAPTPCEHYHSNEWIIEEGGKTHYHECIFCHAKVDEAEHDTSGEWNTDETQHWKVCPVCGIKLSLSDHTFGEWITTKEATTTETGIQTSTCTDCGYAITQTLPVLPPAHTHSYVIVNNDTHHWKECTSKVGSCTATIIEKAEHDFDQGVVIMEATEEADGEKLFTCKTCSFKKTEKVPKLKHVHKFGAEWISDETSHWHVCRCGEKNSTNKHTASDWIVDKNPTATTIGSQHKECTTCKKLLETKEIAKLIAPKIVKGTGQVYTQKSKTDLTITCSDQLENLTGVYVANGLVHKSNYYTDVQNQTLSFKYNYLDSLASGTHTIKLAFSNGTYAETTFTIRSTSAVKTGDGSNYIPLLILLIISTGVLITTSVIRKRGLNG